MKAPVCLVTIHCRLDGNVNRVVNCHWQRKAILLSLPNREKEVQMLVLTRQRDQSIIIGENITITVVDIRGDKVRLGIDAPTEVPVHRQEVYDAIRRNEAAEKERKEAWERKVSSL